MHDLMKRSSKRWFVVLLVFFLFDATVFAQKGLDTSSFFSAIQSYGNINMPVLIGESHEIKSTYATEFFIIEEMVKRGNSTIVLEAGISEVTLLNSFIQTGDEHILQYTRARGGAYQEFMHALRTLSLTGVPITLVGVDFERTICLQYLFEQWFAGIEDSMSNPVINKLRDISPGTSPAKLKRIMLSVKADYEKYEADISVLIPGEASILKQIIYNPVFLADYRFTSKKRDAQILQNLAAISPETWQKAIVIFGSNHFTESNLFWREFAYHPNMRSGYMLFLFAYNNCENLMNDKRYSSAAPLSDYAPANKGTDPYVSFSVQSNSDISPTQSQNHFIVVSMIDQ